MSPEEEKQERRVMIIFGVLIALIVLGFLHGIFTGEFKFEWNKGCREDWCVVED
jgi:hypothetical protein